MTASIGIGIGIRRQSGIGAGPMSPLTELSCYATGIWIPGGVWRMADIWASGRAASRTVRPSNKRRKI